MHKLKNLFLDKTFIKFILVGIINTLFGTAIMFFFYNILHLSYEISTASNYFFGSILSYFLNKYFTFKNKSKGFKTIVRFTINIIVCYFIAYFGVREIINIILIKTPVIVRDNLSMLTGMCVFIVLNYIGQKLFAFSDK